MATGTTAAQGITFLATPFLTRLYGPKDYGLYATFVVASNLLTMVGPGRYENALFVTRDERDLKRLFALALWLSGLTGFVASMASAAFWTTGVTFNGRAFNHTSWMLLGPTVALAAWFQVISTWNTHQRSFRSVTSARVLRSLISSAVQLGAGAVGLINGGLIAGLFAGQLAATTMLAWSVVPAMKDAGSLATWADLKRVALEHKSFPLYGLPSEVLALISMQSPIVIFDRVMSGLFSFSQSVINTPLGFVGTSVLEVFRERGASEYRERGEFRRTAVRMTQVLALAGVPLFSILAFFGPELFALAFGEPWREAGHVARIMAPLYFFKTLSHPLSQAYIIVGRQAESFALQAYLGISTLAVLVYGKTVLDTPTQMLVFYAGNCTLVHVIFIVRSLQFSMGLAKAR